MVKYPQYYLIRATWWWSQTVVCYNPNFSLLLLNLKYHLDDLVWGFSFVSLFQRALRSRDWFIISTTFKILYPLLHEFDVF